MLNFFKKHSKVALLLPTLLISVNLRSQQAADTLENEKFSVHTQATVITQYKPSFHAKYSGDNSLQPNQETERSITATLYLGAKLWRGASLFLNPEIAAGSGLSGSVGVGASTNGETYRIDSPAPSFELARLFAKQVIPLTEEQTYMGGDANTLGGLQPAKYLSITVGKICLSDYFDVNSYSHDPRTQFMSWALMSNGAWDFPANTRGYTPSIILEWVTSYDEVRYAFSLVPVKANGMDMNWNINKAGSHTLEYTHRYSVSGQKGVARLVSYLTVANMGNYNASILFNPTAPDISKTEKSGRTKFGVGLNVEQELNGFLGAFFRASWNDGRNETWAFTEIDRSMSLGLSAKGSKWGRNGDTVGLGYVVSGLSDAHKNYLQAGGKGFELGDGALRYGLEGLMEAYYALELRSNLYLTGAYQLVVNPGYNKDRGPVNVLSVRVHIAF